MEQFDKRGSGGGPPDMTAVWRPTQERATASNTAAFMRAHQIESLDDLRRRSASDPEWFWEAVVEFLGLPFDRPWRAVRDTSRGHPWATWFVGGGFNLSRACVDRWADEDPERIALRSEKETGETRELSFGGLRDVVSRLAGVLIALGVSRGDAVAVYLPMGEEAVVSLLAVGRIGAIFIPVFSGYGAEAVATRLEDPRPKVHDLCGRLPAARHADRDEGGRRPGDRASRRCGEGDRRRLRRTRRHPDDRRARCVVARIGGEAPSPSPRARPAARTRC